MIFNVVSAVFAFIILKPLFLELTENQRLMADWDNVVIVAAFHTAFSFCGTIILLPMIRQFEQLIMKLIPDQTQSVLCYLDQASLSVPALAIHAASKVIYHSLYDVLLMIKLAIQEGRLPSKVRLQQLDEVLIQVQRYLEDMSISENEVDQQRLMAMLRLMVYLRVLRSDLENISLAKEIRTQPAIYQVGLDFVHIMDEHLKEIDDFDVHNHVVSLNTELTNLKNWTEEQRADNREKVLQYTAVNQLNAATGLELLAAQRWLDRVVAHAQRLANVLVENSRKPE